MATSKIDVNLGEVHFSAEGEQDWVSSELEKILAFAAAMPARIQTNEKATVAPPQVDNCDVPSLAVFLKTHHADVNQVQKFLVTSIWLSKKGNAKSSTRDVSGALKNAHQTRLSNPAECLNQNVKKGFCEKDGKNFFVTPEGLKQLAPTSA